MQSHQMIMLKPMCLGISGFARLQCQSHCAMLQIHIRGACCDLIQAFWYGGGGEYRHLGNMTVNARKEASITVDLPSLFYAPERLQALLLLDDEAKPAPLLVGLCTEQSAGSLLDAKNAALALCEKQIKALPSTQRATTPSQIVTEEKAPIPKTEDLPPKEIFLPAIDPLPYIVASDKTAPDLQLADLPTDPPKRLQRSADALPCDILPKRIWPKGYEQLAPYFLQYPPCAPFDLPHWRFVALPNQGVMVGYAHTKGKIHHIGYVYEGQQPPNDNRPYRSHRGRKGQSYHVLWQQIHISP